MAMEPRNAECCLKTSVMALCFILLGFFCPSAAVFIENFSHGRMLPVVCYYEKGQALRPSPMNYDINDVPGHLCSHVNLAYITLNPTTYTIHEDPTIKFADFAKLKRNFTRLKTFISIGGWNNQTKVISAMASMEVRRNAFVNDTVKLLVDHDLDGLDIFWLFPGSVERGGSIEDKVNFVRLLEELYAAFRVHKLLLTAAIPINQKILDNGYDIPEIDRCLDWMNVIGYDLRGYWNGRTDVHGPLHRRSIDGNDTADLNVVKPCGSRATICSFTAALERYASVAMRAWPIAPGHSTKTRITISAALKHKQRRKRPVHDMPASPRKFGEASLQVHPLPIRASVQRRFSPSPPYRHWRASLSSLLTRRGPFPFLLSFTLVKPQGHVIHRGTSGGTFCALCVMTREIPWTWLALKQLC